ncbi:cytochrome P450 oxidoreductase OrdA-like [Aspergillus luchuensis]|uniref:Cytochrome P450 oxidoreductase OrdA-like n=1 Tax=Aspergillus kawachii TaxID=1069201 RepID=A0A146F6F0_ASPKA|nr:cytochrome P450 oxidoreductase OrdA-like [Aspergillus luchuensis]
MPVTLWTGAFVALTSAYIFISFLTRKSKHPPLPPGPRRKPIVGNLWDLPDPNQQDWQHWLKHKDRYGPISSLSIMGQTIIVLNDARLAVELLESRSSIHSSRPQQHFAEMAGWNNVLGAVKQPQRIRATRKNLHREIGSNNSVARFNEIQIAEVGRFLLRVLDAPDKLMQHIRKEAGAIILKVGYGYTIEPHDRDPLVDLADKAMEDFSMAMLPATWAVDFFPPLKETLRWHPVVPMSVAHASTEDDVCEGYFIPKGSSILANIWGFTHDPTAYHDPMTFKPERFLGSKPERDPHFLVFGFGRRVCPGKTLADVNVYFTIAQALSVFEISKPVKDGKVEDIQPEFLPGVISHPAPFNVSIRPRSAKHLELLRSLEERYPWEKSNAEDLGNVQY